MTNLPLAFKDSRDKKMFELIVGYVSSGGDIKNQFVRNYLERSGVTKKDILDFIDARIEEKLAEPDKLYGN